MIPVALNLEVSDVHYLFTSDKIESGDDHHQDADGDECYAYFFHVHGFEV